jgi:hypothetical protein
MTGSLHLVNAFLEWTSFRLEYSRSGELVARRVRSHHGEPGLYQDTRERRARIAIVRELLSLAELGLLRQLHQCPGCRWWFTSRSHGKHCPAPPLRSASKCKQAADAAARRKATADAIAREMSAEAMDRRMPSLHRAAVGVLLPAKTARGRL